MLVGFYHSRGNKTERHERRPNLVEDDRVRHGRREGEITL